MSVIYRVQGSDGRGPWRPGFSHRWVDAERTEQLPSIIEEFPSIDYGNLSPDKYYGCGCRDVQSLLQWFTESECRKLEFYKYKVVALDDCEIIAESPNQVVFSRDKPLFRDTKSMTFGAASFLTDALGAT